jgi:hypothetical protein
VKRTTVAERAKDLVGRNFAPLAPDRLWVADFTHVSTLASWVYVAFVIDAYARRILGWKASSSMTADLVLAAVDQAIFTRQRAGVNSFEGLIHHTDYAEVGVKPENLRMAWSGPPADGFPGLTSGVTVRRIPCVCGRRRRWI